ncbi:MAG: flagellar hook-basal body complex protein FliE [Pseudomonadota bacterium]
MDMKPINAAQSYAAARPATEPGVKKSVPMGEAAREVAHDFATTLQQTEATAKAAMVGEADPHSLVQALAQTELAVETAITIRNRVVEAYQEILRMPV